MAGHVHGFFLLLSLQNEHTTLVLNEITLFQCKVPSENGKISTVVPQYCKTKTIAKYQLISAPNQGNYIIKTTQYNLV